MLWCGRLEKENQETQKRAAERERQKIIQQKKRDAPEPPSSEEAEVVPLRFNGILQPGWDFLVPKSSLPPPPAPR